MKLHPGLLLKVVTGIDAHKSGAETADELPGDGRWSGYNNIALRDATMSACPVQIDDVRVLLVHLDEKPHGQDCTDPTRFCEEEQRMARLLIVDDEKSLCQVLKIALRKNGHLVETASSGQAAKRKIESRVFDLIISDIRMPDLTGIDLLEYAHKTHNTALFILMTAVPTLSTAIQAVNLGLTVM